MIKILRHSFREWISLILNVVGCVALEHIIPNNFIIHLLVVTYCVMYVILKVTLYVEYKNPIFVSFRYFRTIYNLNPSRFNLSAYPLYIISETYPVDEITFQFSMIGYIRYLLFLYNKHRITHIKKISSVYLDAIAQMEHDIHLERENSLKYIKDAEALMKSKYNDTIL